MSELIPLPTIKGLVPLIDARRLGEARLVEAQNVLVDPDGIRTAFSRKLWRAKGFAQPYNFYSFRVNNDAYPFLFVQDGVYRFDHTTRAINLQYAFSTPLTTFYRWHHANVNGIDYFACRGVGLLQFTAATNTWKILSGGSIPSNIYGCTAIGGRLVVLAAGLVAWTAIDDGEDFVPSTSTGAGFQGLSLINATGADQALTIQAVRNGFAVITTEGLLQGALTTGQTVFRWTRFLNKGVALNSHCVANIDDNEQIVILTRAGFQKFSGVPLNQARTLAPQPWQELWSEWFQTRYLRTRDLIGTAQFRLVNDPAGEWIGVGMAEAGTDGLFSRTWVINQSNEEWGSFNRQAVGYGDIFFSDENDFGWHSGYVAPSGHIFEFTGEARDSDYSRSTDQWHVDHILPAEPATQGDGSSEIYRDELRIYDYPISKLTVAGIYDFRRVIQTLGAPVANTTDTPTDETASPIKFRDSLLIQQRTQELTTGLAATHHVNHDAIAHIGVFNTDQLRSERKTTDQLAEIFTVAIATNPGTTTIDLFVDWVLDFLDGDIDEDWAALSGDEDWGEANDSESTFQLILQGTINGENVWNNQETMMQLIESDSVLGLKYFAGRAIGLHHRLCITTENDEDNFFIKTVSLDAITAGQIR